MDFRNEASSWTIHHLAEDIFGVCFRLRYIGNEMTHLQSLQQDSSTSCAESSWERAPNARGLECVSLASKELKCVVANARLETWRLSMRFETEDIGRPAHRLLASIQD